MKLLHNIMFGLATVVISTATATMPAQAQQTVGSWQIYNNYTTTISNLIDTPQKVYLVSDGNLFSYDKETEEMYEHTRLNSLSDNVVTDIRRNYDKNYIVVFYQTGNIDIIYDDGTVANLPDIVDATSVTSKVLYDVAFVGDQMYVATSFGLVLYNVKSASVKESGIYNLPAYGVTILGDQVVVALDGTTAYRFTHGQRFSTLNNLTKIGDFNMRQIEALTDKLMFGTRRGSDNQYGMYSLDTEANTITTIQTATMPSQHVPGRIDNDIILSNPYGFYVIHANSSSSRGYDMNYHSVGNGIQYSDKCIYSGGYTSGNKFWFANGLGLGYMIHDGSYNNFTANLDSQARPFGTNIDTGVAGMTAGTRGIYLYNRCASRYPAYTNTSERVGINLLDNGFFTDITPSDIISRVKRSTGGAPPQRVVEDPVDPSVIYFGSWFEGIHVNRDGTDILKFDWRNTPADSTWCHANMDIAFDTHNNLWACTLTMNGLNLMVLPAAKRMDPTTTAADWTEISIGSLASDYRTRDFNILPLRVAKNNNLILFSDGFDPNNLAILNTGGNVTSTSGHTSRATDHFIDQDGKSFGPISVTRMAEDLNGAVWVGTKSGVFAINTPANFLSENATVERIKVPRNDGTSLADYLLDNQIVTAIAVDGANRKWLGTSTSGVYLVTSDGKEIIENYNTSNSPLPSNTVKDIICDLSSNRVYIATSAGLASYSSTASPAEETFDNVYAYPNPVRPDYDGWITVTGLMENSLVKICNQSGNVLYQTRSSGGMVTWNGCNTSGHRVRSGVYYVFASNGEETTTGKVVTKILVVN